MQEFKMPTGLDERLIGYVTRNRERGSGYENVRMVRGNEKGPKVHDPFWKLKGQGTATYHILSTLLIGDNRWLVALFIPNSYLGVPEYMVAEYHGDQLVSYTVPPEMHDMFLVKTKSTSDRIIADFACDEATGKLSVAWCVLRPVELPQSHVDVFDTWR